MIRFLVRTLLAILANALGLYIASLVLEDFNLSLNGFLTAVVVFSLSMIVLGPLIMKIALTNMPALMGGIALVTTLVSLMLTTIFTDGLTISGLSTWVLATLIVWLCSLIATVVLPLFMFKSILQNNKSEPAKTE